MGSQDTHAGSAMQRARLARGMTRAELATEVCRDPQTIARWESGRQCPPQAVMLRICRVLACAPADLVDA